MIFNEAVTSVTRTYIVPKVFDTVSKGTPSLMNFLRKAKSWKTGVAYQSPIKYADTTNGGNTGIADKLDTDRQNVRTQMTFYPKMAYKPVVTALIEETLNQGEEQVVELVEAEFDSQAQSLIQLMGQNLFTGNGSGNSWDSFRNAADDGSTYPVYGGLSRTAYPTLDGFYLPSAGALTLAKLATGHDAVSVGMDQPTQIFTTKSIWSSYESLLTPTVRANYVTTGYPRANEYGMVPAGQSFGGVQGFEYLMFRGTPFIKDEQIPSGELYFNNENYFSFKGINVKGMKQMNFKKLSNGVPEGVPGRVPSTKGFNFRDFMTPIDQLANIGFVIYSGNFISENPRTLGLFTGAN